MNKFFDYHGVGLSNKLYCLFISKFPHFKGKGYLSKLITNIFFPYGLRLKSVYGAKMVFHPGDYLDDEIIKHGSYESETLKLCNKLLHEGGVFVDIGANIGIYSLNMCANQKNKVLAIEPNSKAAYYLQNNIELNGFKNIILANIGLSNAEGLAEMGNPCRSNLGTNKIIEKHEFNYYRKHYVYVLTLNSLLNFIQDLHCIDVLKIDVEGHEMKIFKGFDINSIYRPKNIIIEFGIEWVGHTIEVQNEIYNFFIDNGYKAFTIDEKPFKLGQKCLIDNNLWFKDVH